MRFAPFGRSPKFRLRRNFAYPPAVIRNRGRRAYKVKVMAMVKNITLADEWSTKEILINFPLLVIYLTIGLVGMYLENQIASFLYLLFIIFPLYLVNRYVVCSKCYYFDKRCYMFGRKCSSALFKKREGNYTKFENAYVGIMWMLSIIIPIYWLAIPIYRSPSLLNVTLLVAFLVCSIGWQAVHSNTCCTKCKNFKCGMNRASKHMKEKNISNG